MKTSDWGTGHGALPHGADGGTWKDEAWTIFFIAVLTACLP